MGSVENCFVTRISILSTTDVANRFDFLFAFRITITRRRDFTRLSSQARKNNKYQTRRTNEKRCSRLQRENKKRCDRRQKTTIMMSNFFTNLNFHHFIFGQNYRHLHTDYTSQQLGICLRSRRTLYPRPQLNLKKKIDFSHNSAPPPQVFEFVRFVRKAARQYRVHQSRVKLRAGLNVVAVA